MNTKSFFAVVAISTISTFAVTAAHAGEATYEYPVATVSTLTRADVQAAAQQARTAGLIVSGERSVVAADTLPAVSRAQVRAETREAIRLGATVQHEQSLPLSDAKLDRIRRAGLMAAATAATASL